MVKLSVYYTSCSVLNFLQYEKVKQLKKEEEKVKQLQLLNADGVLYITKYSLLWIDSVIFIFIFIFFVSVKVADIFKILFRYTVCKETEHRREVTREGGWYYICNTFSIFSS